MKCAEIEDQETRDYITLIILELLLRELFIFRYMQTDPNWANFLFNPETKQVGDVLISNLIIFLKTGPTLANLYFHLFVEYNS